MKIKDKILSETSEEVKQRVRDTANKLVMKQETLEEAIERTKEEYPVWLDEEAFILGAKWQQERSYSEEEVYGILMKFFLEEDRKHIINPMMVEEWFEQFKKK